MSSDYKNLLVGAGTRSTSFYTEIDKSMVTTVADGRSRLNPNAPIFIPQAVFNEVEDFSPEWWDLVKTSPWFREYWLSQYQEDDFISSADLCFYVELEEFPDTDGAHFVESEALEKGIEPPNCLGMDAKALLKNLNLNLTVSKLSNGRGAKPPIEPAKYCEKKRGYKRLNAKCNTPRRIHQPR